MPSPDTILRSIKEVCEGGRGYGEGSLAQELNISTIELDGDGAHEDVTLPVLEMQPSDVQRDRSLNTDVVGFERNEQGEPIGRIIEKWYTMVVDIDLSTAQGSNVNHREQIEMLKEILVVYEDQGLSNPLPDPDDSTSLQNVTSLVVDESGSNNTFTTSPSIRGASLRLLVKFEERLYETDLVDLQDPYTGATISLDPDASASDTTDVTFTASK